MPNVGVLAVILFVIPLYGHATARITVEQKITPSNIHGAAPPKSISIDSDSSSLVSTYSSQLTYSTGPIQDHTGRVTPTGTANTSVSYDLTRGEFKLYADSVLPGAYTAPIGALFSSTYLGYVDQLTVTSPHATVTTPTFISLALELHGQFIPMIASNGGGGSTITFTASSITNDDLRIDANAQIDSGCSSSDYCTGRGSGSGVRADGVSYVDVIPGLQYGSFDEIKLTMALYAPVSVIDFNIGVTVAGSNGAADFSHTAKFLVDVPSDATFTSQSGYLLTAVPEPESYAMLLAGLGLVGFAARRKKRTP